MSVLLSGIETEYGLLIEDRGADTQVEDSQALVRTYSGKCFVGWDYGAESPRADLRGFQLDRLAVDPVDAKFDAGRSYGSSIDIRSDRILPNGARFYNDHGHPEYSTPECRSLLELAKHDSAGEAIVLRTAKEYGEQIGKSVQIYKNNTDFHGASYGTHESYLVPREVGYEKLFAAVTPILVARQILVGAGKVGAEQGASATYQLSQRADFFMEAANAETLYRRPIFNTRDEPHADPSTWIRLHVIAGDANMIANATARKVGLVRLALRLLQEGDLPQWSLEDPVKAFQAISRDETTTYAVALKNRSWTTGPEILESYFAAAEATLELDSEDRWLIDSSRKLLRELTEDFASFAREVDWAAKRRMLEQFMESEGTDWRDPALRSYDLEYHNVDPEEGLHAALVELGQVAANPEESELEIRRERIFEPTRARAREIAVTRFGSALHTAGWRRLVFRVEDRLEEVDLAPDRDYPESLYAITSVEEFISQLRAQP